MEHSDGGKRNRALYKIKKGINMRNASIPDIQHFARVLSQSGAEGNFVKTEVTRMTFNAWQRYLITYFVATGELLIFLNPSVTR